MAAGLTEGLTEDVGVDDGVGKGFEGLPQPATRAVAAVTAAIVTSLVQRRSRLLRCLVTRDSRSAGQAERALLSSNPLCLGSPRHHL